MSKAPNAEAPALEWALFYASLGWAVFPIQPQTKNSFYRYPEFKNPETGSEYSWQYQASSDPERVRRFWTDHPRAGIGVATGQRSGGLYVLDLDKEKPGKTKDGRKHFMEWQKIHGTANVNTPVNRTGGGGHQLFYKCQERPRISGTASGAGTAAIYAGYGVDTRGDGNFCVLPPSIHPSGQPYTWKQDPAAYAPQEPNEAVRAYWLGDHLGNAAEGQERPRARFDLPEQIPEGSRTQTLVQYAGSLVERGKGLNDEEIRALVIQANDERCSPPLDARKLEREVLRSIPRFRARQAAQDFQEEAQEAAPQIDPEEYTQRAAGAFVARFWTDAENRTPAIKTGFPQLDEFLDGGLYPGLYVLGAVSSLGKTTYALQLADQIATEGTDVLFFSLEMSRAELMAKSMSRLTAILAARSAGKTIAEATEAQELPNAKTARALTDPARFMHFNGEEQDLVRQAAALYQEYGARIWIDEGPARQGISAEYVRKAVEQHIAITGRRPVIFLDYLQIMESPDNRLTDKQKTDQNVRELRDIGRRNNCPVVAISSLNRENYSAPMNMAAFKESGAIEYSSDVLMGLQPVGMDEAGTGAAAANNANLVDKTKILPVRSVELKILKQRGGVTGRRIAYKYAAAFNVFEEDGESLERVNTRGKKSRKAQEAAERRASIPDTLDKILGELQNITGNPFLTEKEDLDDF